MRALSIRQPWAWSITRWGKRVENRTWNTGFRGEFLIHAGKGLTRDELEGWADMILAEDIQAADLRGRNWHERDFDRGGIVGIAELVSVVSGDAPALADDQRPWYFGPHAFVLDRVRPLPFIPCKGALGFFTVTPEVEAEVRKAMIA